MMPFLASQISVIEIIGYHAQIFMSATESDDNDESFSSSSSSNSEGSDKL